MSDLALQNAAEAGRMLAAGEVSAVDMAEAMLARVEEVDGDIDAWAYLDPGHVRAQAEALDRHREAGLPLGPLHGLPVGLKDIIDTADMPTENGTVLDAGRRPREDAVIVQRLRQAGALIMGKTVTTELAYFEPGKTRNPHNRDHTPGGSSSGSAAAVASAQLPLAVGTQTNGSMIRPASFCGIFGYKPTFGLLPRTGVLRTSGPLDVLGVYGRSVEDVALIGDVVAGFDDGDEGSLLTAHPRLRETAMSDPPVKPSFAMVRTPVWDKAEDATREAFDELADALGDACDVVDLPSPFATGHDVHHTIMFATMAKNLAGYHERGAAQLSQRMRDLIEEGRQIPAVDYMDALDWVEVLNAGLEEIFERYDAILTPSAPGEAPHGLGATGDPSFCTLWTLCGTPSISLPLLEGPNGLPVGVQVVGPRLHDGRLLRSANWLWNEISTLED